MSLWGWIFGLAANVAVNVFWGGVIGGALYLVYRTFHRKT